MMGNFQDVLEKVAGMVHDQFDVMLTSTNGRMPSQEMIDDSLKKVIVKLTLTELQTVCYTVLAGTSHTQAVFDLMVLNKSIDKAGSETCIIQR